MAEQKKATKTTDIVSLIIYPIIVMAVSYFIFQN